MTRNAYAQVLNRVLVPLGFKRNGLDWVRIREDMEEVVSIQPNWLGGRTVNFFMKDLETEKTFLKIFGPEGATRMGYISAQIGQLIDNHHRRWRDEPGGPEEMADLTVKFGVPWFDKVRTLEEQAANWYGRYSEVTRDYHAPSMIGLSLTLYRMGELAEACAVLNKPVPKTAIPENVRTVAVVRQWLACDGTEAAARSGNLTK